MKSIRKLIIALVVVMSAALMVAPTFAQDNTTPTPPASGSSIGRRPTGAGNGSSTQPTNRTITITITQEQINTRLANRPGDRLKDLSVVLGDNQITVSFTTNGEKNNSVGRAIVGVVTPAVKDGKVDWTLNSLTIDGKAATQEQMDKLKERVAGFIAKFEELERRFTVNGLTVNKSGITVTVTRKKSA